MVVVASGVGVAVGVAVGVGVAVAGEVVGVACVCWELGVCCCWLAADDEWCVLVAHLNLF